MDNVEKLITDIRKQRKIKLVGSCKKCGKCCEGNVKIFQVIPNDTVKLIRREDKPCIYYDEINKICKDYEHRCTWCSMFPYLPENLYEGCGYHFEPITEEDEKEISKSEFEQKFIEDTKEEISKLDYKKYFYQYNKFEKNILAQEMKDITNFFEEELELAVYPVYGTLLGMVRDNDFIAWDTDIDMAYLSKCTTEKAVLNEWNMICKFLNEHKMLMWKCKTASHAHLFSPNGHLRIDLWISWLDANNKYYLTWIFDGEFDSTILLPFNKIIFKDQEFLLMQNYEKHLEFHYGPNWKNPIAGDDMEKWSPRERKFRLEKWHGK